jgi:hypothetical protein
MKEESERHSNSSGAAIPYSPGKGILQTDLRRCLKGFPILQVPARVEALDLPTFSYYHEPNDPTAAVLQATAEFVEAEGGLDGPEPQIGVFRDASMASEGMLRQ